MIPRPIPFLLLCFAPAMAACDASPALGAERAPETSESRPESGPEGPEVSVREGSGVRRRSGPALDWTTSVHLAASQLARHPEWARLDPIAHPPHFEAVHRRPGSIRVRYRQELEMSYGTLVAVFRGDLILESGSEAEHLDAHGPAPQDWTPIPPSVSRQVWRRVEPQRTSWAR